MIQRVLTFTLTVIIAISVATPSFAAGSDPMNIGRLEMIFAIIVFLIFASILGFLVWPKVLGAVQAREAKLEGDLVGAENARQEHEKLVAEYKGKLAEAQKEYQNVVDEARRDASQLAASLKADAEKQIVVLKARAEAEIQAAKEQALAEIYEQTATLATDVAGKILSREVSAQDHQALVQESLAKLA